jgi:hypothetical protein
MTLVRRDDVGRSEQSWPRRSSTRSPPGLSRRPTPSRSRCRRVQPDPSSRTRASIRRPRSMEAAEGTAATLSSPTDRRSRPRAKEGASSPRSRTAERRTSLRLRARLSARSPWSPRRRPRR